MVLGAVAYWRYAAVRSHSKGLVIQNQELQESNVRISELAYQLASLEESNNRIRTALGIGEETAGDERRHLGAVNAFAEFSGDGRPAVGGPEYTSSSEELKQTLSFLVNASSVVHDYVRCVPTLLPVEGFVSAEFVEARDVGEKSHQGIDIVGEVGKTIKAAADGVVVFAGWAPDLGNMVIIDHLNGFLTLYGHNQRILVNNREPVRKGAPIALLGSSGESSGPHLHFEIWKNGVPVNPKNYILALGN
jgi:murein DD-endopeptidase MepM/ murein hydrolase activator NlpD